MENYNQKGIASEIVLIPEATFKCFPPKCFTRIRDPAASSAIPNLSVATLITDTKEFSNYPQSLIVNSLSELEEIRQQICNRPLVLKVTCGKHVPQGQKLNRKGEYLSIRDREWWFQSQNTPWGNPYGHDGWGTGSTTMYGDRWIMPHFVASVDTTHPSIKHKLEEGFSRAATLAAQGKRFHVEFDFNPPILEWWKRQGPARYDQIECLAVTKVTGASFALTNHSALNHCFDCHPGWYVCWPAYCLTAIPYKVWRNGVQGVSDINLNMAGNVSVARPDSPGYELADLHQEAAVQKTQPDNLVTG